MNTLKLKQKGIHGILCITRIVVYIELCIIRVECIYGVATTSRLLKTVGLFCRISSLLQGSFAKETYNFKEPTNRSHPICIISVECMYSNVCTEFYVYNYVSSVWHACTAFHEDCFTSKSSRVALMRATYALCDTHTVTHTK